MENDGKREQFLQQLVIIQHEPRTNALNYMAKLQDHPDYSMCRYLRIKSVALLSNPPDKIPIEQQTVKSAAVKSHALAILSAEQARESSGHGVVKSNRLSQEVLELPAWWSGSFASVVGSAAAGCQPSYSKERSHKPSVWSTAIQNQTLHI